MRIGLTIATVLAGTASLASAQLVGGVVSGAAGAVQHGATAVDPMPGSDVPTPSIVGHPSPNARAVQVSAGARVQVARETRCYDGDRYWDPASGPDGHYYCETTGPGAAAGVTTGH